MLGPRSARGARGEDGSRPTDRPTNRRTGRPTVERTDRPTHRSAAGASLENIAGRVALQALFSFLVAPVVAVVLVRLYCLVVRPHWLWGYVMPPGVPTIFVSTALITVRAPSDRGGS